MSAAICLVAGLTGIGFGFGFVACALMCVDRQSYKKRLYSSNLVFAELSAMRDHLESQHRSVQQITKVLGARAMKHDRHDGDGQLSYIRNVYGDGSKMDADP